MVIAGFVLAILAFLLGAFPFIGWLLVLLATIFTLVGFKGSEQRGLSITSLVLVILTWIYKIIIIFGMASFLFGQTETIVEEGGVVVDTADGVEIVIGESEDTTEPQDAKIYELNETVAYEETEYVITSVEEKEEISGQIADEGNVYVVVQYELKNTGTEPLSWVFTPEITLMDGNGSNYGSDGPLGAVYAIDMDIEYKQFNDLNPGLSVKNVDIFEVSKQSFEEGNWFVLIDDIKVKIK